MAAYYEKQDIKPILLLLKQDAFVVVSQRNTQNTTSCSFKKPVICSVVSEQVFTSVLQHFS